VRDLRFVTTHLGHILCISFAHQVLARKALSACARVYVSSFAKATQYLFGLIFGNDSKRYTTHPQALFVPLLQH
jgi:hypothetical protein